MKNQNCENEKMKTVLFEQILENFRDQMKSKDNGQESEEKYFEARGDEVIFIASRLLSVEDYQALRDEAYRTKSVIKAVINGDYIRF